MKNFERFTVDPAQMGDVPCVAEILAEIPICEKADIRVINGRERVTYGSLGT